MVATHTIHLYRAFALRALGRPGRLLQHVSLEIRKGDTARTLAFCGVLGFDEVDPPESLRERTAWVQRGATQVHLLWTDDPVAPPSGHAAVVVEDWERTVSALRAAGYEPEERPRHWGARRVFVRDPTGHRVEVMAAPPPGLPSRA